MRTIGVVTTSRADYGIYRPILRAIEASDELRLRLYVSGTHLSTTFGMTVREIEEDRFEIAERIEMMLSSDSPEGIAKSMGIGTMGFSQAFARSKPDILVVLGDRFEMHAAGLAALPFTIPVAHIHGGETTAGAIDESLRHSLTKLSHLHFTATEEYARRVIQMGEEPWRVTVSGAPALDAVKGFVPTPVGDLESFCGMDLPERGFLLVTFHSATIESGKAGEQARELLSAIAEMGLPALFTMPNADAGGHEIRRQILEFVGTTPHARVVENLGARRYFSLMSRACAMVGNSSSGLVEAASFGLPVVNVGDRQAGRTRSANVVDVDGDRVAIGAAIWKATSQEFRSSLGNLVNLYGDGTASSKITARLTSQALGPPLLRKKFYRVPGATNG
jgi:UDP-hydrolysing UDP-N-acetyl-D-glucosamine 2-epimerase